MKTLITNGEVLCMTGEDVRQVDVGIEDDTIAFIGKAPATFIADRTIDASDQVVMPGLINGHTHASMTLFRNLADDLLFWDWLEGTILPMEAHLRAKDVYHGARLAIAEMIRSGITTFTDMYFHMDQVARAVEETGIRANLATGITGQGIEDEEKIKDAVAFHKVFHGKANGRIQVDFAPHAPYTCDDAFIKKIIDAAGGLDTRVHIHLSESRGEIKDSLAEYNQTPIERMASLGLFALPVYAAHCVHLTDEDINILAHYQVSVINNPGSNLKIANGFAPVKKMLEAGINVGLGTDGAASNNNLNMFEEMSLAALINKGLEEDAQVVPAYQALKMATINGAKALGLNQWVGTLEVGKKADIILIDLNKPHFYPRFKVIPALVYAAQAQDVRTVICNGEILMRDYLLQTMDEKTVMDEANGAAIRLKEANA